MSPNTVYLITGANRGIGKGLLATYLARPNTTVIAGVRDPDNASSKALSDLPKGSSSTLITVKIDSASETDVPDALKLLQSVHQISTIDVVIANAGINKSYATTATVTLAEMQEHILVNALAPLFLFQAVLPFLQKSAQPKFIIMGSPIGSIGGMELRPYPMAAYGGSKALAHWLTRKIHFEHESLIAFVIDPGFVQTDMGNSGAIAFGMTEATTTIKDSVDGMVVQIDGATREKTSGHFAGFNGEEFPW